MTTYLISLATTGVLFAIIALGLHVRWGLAGEFDLSLFAIAAIGGYVYAVLALPPAHLPPPATYILGLKLPFLVSLAGAIIVSGLLSAMIGAVALRKLRDDYFGITTVATALILALFIGQYIPLFDGYAGLGGIPQPLANLPGWGANGGYFLGVCVVALIVVYFILERLNVSPFGRALRSVREDDVASQAFGRNAYALKLKAYVLGGCVAGLGGALLAAYLTAFNSYAWTPTETFLLYAAIFVGGTGNIRGAILGTFFVEVVIQEVTRYIPAVAGNSNFPDAARLVVIGLLIVGVLWLRPRGLFPEPRARDKGPGSTAEVATTAVPTKGAPHD